MRKVCSICGIKYFFRHNCKQHREPFKVIDDYEPIVNPMVATRMAESILYSNMDLSEPITKEEASFFQGGESGGGGASRNFDDVPNNDYPQNDCSNDDCGCDSDCGDDCSCDSDSSSSDD